jgi:uncharacterized protein YjbJ (UPF0337 family)
MGERTMTEIDKLQGQAKEAVGKLTDDEKLKREGRVEQASTEAKEAFEEVKEKISEVAEKVGGAVGEAIDKAGEVAAEIKE